MPRPPLLVALLFLFSVACSSPEKQGKFPARQANCEVDVFPDAPAYPSENIGPVQASCDASVTDSECLRELKDQACKLGGDTVWGVSEPPAMHLGKKKYSGRAAHRK